MDYVTLKFLHVAGAMLTLLGYGALLGRAWVGSQHIGLRKFGAISSGVGLLLLLATGLYLAIDTYGFKGGWIHAKLTIWLILGGVIALINRKPGAAPVWWALTLLLALTSAYLGLAKPF